MATSPETAKPPDTTSRATPPPPLFPSPLQKNPSLTTAAPPEPSPPSHATPIPPSSSGQAWPEADEPLPSTPTPIDGPPGAAGPPPPSFPSSLELDTSVVAAAAKPSSRSLLRPGEALFEFYHDAAPLSPSSSEETAEDASTASPPATPPPLVLCASPDSYYSDPDAMESPPRDPMGSDEGWHTAPESPTPPLEARQEGFQQQQPPIPFPTNSPECDSSEPAELPLPPTSPAEISRTSPDADEIVDVVAVTPGETPAGSTIAMEVTHGEMEIDTVAVSVPPVLECGEEVSLQESMQRPSSLAMNIEQETVQRPSSPAMDAEIDIVVAATPEVPVSMPPAPVLESGEGSVQESMQSPSSLATKAEQESVQRTSSPTIDTKVDVVVVATPEEAPGSSTLAMEVTYGETDTATVMTLEEAPGSKLAMEVIYGETGTAAVSVPLSPVLKSGEEGSLQESMQKPSSPAMNSEPESMQKPSSPAMNTEPESMQRPPSPAMNAEEESTQRPSSPTMNAETDVMVAVTPEEAPVSMVAMEVTYGATDMAAVSVPPAQVLESGEKRSLQESIQRPSSLAMKAQQESMQRPSSLTLHTEIETVAVAMPEEAPGPTVATEVTYRETDTAAVSVLPAPALEGGDEGSMHRPSSLAMNTQQESMQRPSSPTMDTEIDTVVAAMPEEAPGSIVATDVTYRETDTAAVSVPPAPVLESGDVGSLQESMQGPSSFVMNTEPGSMQGSSSTTMDTKIDVVVSAKPEEAPGSMLAVEVTYGETDIAAVSVPPALILESGEEVSLEESTQRPSSPATNTDPVSMQRPSSPTVDTEIDVAVAARPENAPGSTLEMEEAHRETDTTTVSVPLAPVLEGGEKGSLQESMQRSFSPKMNTELESMQRLSSPAMDIEPESMQKSSSPTLDTKPCSPEMVPPGFECFKASWLPLPPPIPAESIPPVPVAAAPEALVVMPEEAAESLPSSEALHAEKHASVTQAEPNSPDAPPPGFENFKSSWLPLSMTHIPVETTDVFPDVVVTKTVEAPIEEVSGRLPVLEVMNMETDIVLNVLPTERAQELLQQPLLRPPSPVAQSESRSQDEMAPPGFENFKSSSEPCFPEEMASSGFENLRSSSEPCSPEEMAPPGFENFKSSWPPLPTLPQTTYALPNAAAIDASAVTLEDKAGSPVLEAMDVDMDTIHPPPLSFDSRVEGSLQEPLQRAPSPIMQEAPCLPDRAPPGFETFKSSQILLPSLSLAQTTNAQQDQLVSEAVSLIEEAPQPLHSVDVMGANMDAEPPLLLPSESGPDGPSPQQVPCLASPAEKGTITCLPDIVRSGGDDLEPSQLLPSPAVISPVQTPDGLADVPAIDRIAVASEESPHRLLVSGGMEDGTVPIQSSPLDNTSEGSLPQLESQVHSSTAQAANSLLDAPGSKSLPVASEEMPQPPLASQATNTDHIDTTEMQPQSEGIVGELLQPQHPPSSAHSAPYLQDSMSLVLPPPPLHKEIGQMVCGSCRVLLAYFRGAGHVHCTCCQTMNLVLEV
uniref:Zinc finger LSD1-type domain-containing protein n=1 Tax=Leersia perrieri TaxID=77586 RepID=A0A0D9V2U7_9ORYZ